MVSFLIAITLYIVDGRYTVYHERVPAHGINYYYFDYYDRVIAHNE